MSSSAMDNTPPKRVGFLRLKAVIGLPLVIGIALLVYNFTIDGAVKDFLVAQGAGMAGYAGKASVDEVKFSIFGPKLYVKNLHIYQAPPGGPEHTVLRAGEANLDLELLPLLERRLVVREIRATKIEFQRPLAASETGAPPPPPPQTENKDANDYIKQVEGFFKSDEFAEIRKWLEKIRASQQQAPVGQGDVNVKPAPQQPTLLDPGPAGRAAYVTRALADDKAPPAVVVMRAALEQLDFNFGKPGDKTLASSITDVKLEAKELSSDPVSYGRPITMSAGGNLGGDAGKRLDLDLVVRFDPKQLIKIEQVRGNASYAQVPLAGIVDTSIFGDYLRDLRMSVSYYAPEHAELAGRACISLSGNLTPPGSLDTQGSRLAVNIWLGGYKGTDAAAALMPSGIGFSVERVPLDGLLRQAGGSPAAVEPGATISFGTCDANGRTGTPEAAFTWHDGMNCRLRLSIDKLAIKPKAGNDKILGISSKDFCSAFNTFMTAQGKDATFQLSLFDAKGRFAPALEKPGTRGLIDGIVAVLAYTGAEANKAFDLPFTLSDKAVIKCASINADGSVRTMFGPDSMRGDLGDLRIRLLVKDIYAAKKAGRNEVMGIPAEHFTFAWNAMVATFPAEGFPFVLRLFNDKGVFEPTVVSPTPTELTTMLGAAVGISLFEKNFGQLATKFGPQFAQFQKGGLSAAPDIAKALTGGKVIDPKTLPVPIPKEIPKELPKEAPKLPNIKLPW
ncbi:MAG: hypothetical protein IT462_12260 [Planctomycetes bacterium]|nr:hypothetical protein [Planctomycetota bacterium]